MTEFTDSDGRAITAPNASNQDTSGLTRGWRQSKWLILVELFVVILIFVADALHFIPLSKTPFLLAVGWISLRMRNLRWRDVGLSLYQSWPITLAAGVSVGLLLEAFQLFVSQPILVRVLRKQPDLELFRALHGDVKWTLLAIAGAWTLAAFGEEMVYRGYLMNRVADLMKQTRWAWVVSLIVVHVGFGMAHAYQGITGIIDEGLAGLLFGVVYLRNGRNLAVPIIAHGIGDTIDFLLIFAGKYPGM
jgi:membrane protease YdiL (CAAX protease family)